jgi:hypothetical protein
VNHGQNESLFLKKKREKNQVILLVGLQRRIVYNKNYNLDNLIVLLNNNMFLIMIRGYPERSEEA